MQFLSLDPKGRGTKLKFCYRYKGEEFGKARAVFAVFHSGKEKFFHHNQMEVNVRSILLSRRHLCPHSSGIWQEPDSEWTLFTPEKRLATWPKQVQRNLMSNGMSIRIKSNAKEDLCIIESIRIWVNFRNVITSDAMRRQCSEE